MRATVVLALLSAAAARGCNLYRLTKTGNLLRVEVVGTNPKARPQDFMSDLDCIVLKKQK